LVDPGAYADEADLVTRCLRGDGAAQRSLYRTHFSRVHATAFRITGSPHEAEDVTQETFVEAFRSLKGFEARSKIATWIDRIAVRVAFRHLAERKGDTTFVGLGEVAGATSSPEQHVHARDGLRRLYAALAELSPAARIAFVLHAIDGRSISEAAQLSDASVTATKVRIWRARRALERQAAGDPVLASFICRDQDGEEPA
jgi:RNA polymerase sigma-70 factor (ECF subfamily)